MLIVDQVRRGDPRLRLLAAAFAAGLCILLAGLYYVQIVCRQKYENSLKVQSFRTVRLPAARGRIFDRSGHVLADNEPRFNINLFIEDIRSRFYYEYTNRVVKEFVAEHHRKPRSSAEKNELSRIARYRVVSNIVWQVSSAVLPFPLVLVPEEFEKHYNERRAMPMPIVTDLTAQQIALFSERAWDVPGIELEVEPYRFYPYGSLAAHALGYVQLDRKDEESSDDEINCHYSLPVYDGITGLEGKFNDDLRGQAGARAILVNNIGYRQSEETWVEPVPGKNVYLTLDLEVQKAAERALLMSGPDARGAAVVLDCRTGDVLALASAPSYDLNMFVRPGDFSTNDWNRVLRDEELAPMYNRALQGAYHPGSIFKIVVALALFEAGAVSPSDTVTVGADKRFWLGRRPIKDTAPPGVYDFKEAFKHSCNTYFIKYGLELGVDKIVEMGTRFDLGERTGVVQARIEQSGYFPKVGQRTKFDGQRWTDGDTANLCIGQGEITVTPMQMALMTAAVANGGKLIKPRLVMELEDQINRNRLETMPASQIETDLHLSKRSLDLVRSAMRADVEEHGGTGREAYIPGMGICGKTGTAQVWRNGHMDHITWFASFAPFQSPRYVVIVVVEGGDSGGGTCAPKAKEIYKALQKLENDRLKDMAGH